MDERARWLQNNAAPLGTISIEEPDLTDLAPVGKAVADAQVVLLGEVLHGDGAAYDGKARLVRYLHEQAGFDCLAWEAGIYSCRRMQDALQAGAQTPEAVRTGLFPIWHVRSIERLYDYLRQTTVETAGFDCQLFSGDAGPEQFAEELPTWFEDAPLTQQEWGAVRAMVIATGPEGNRETRATNREIRATGYPLLERLRQTPLAESPERSWRIQCLHNLAIYGHLMDDWNPNFLHPDNAEAFAESERRRDEAMGDNLAWLADSLYPTRRIISWMATGHAVRNLPGAQTLGQRAWDHLGTRMYTIGFLSYEGEIINPFDGKAYPTSSEPGSLDWLFHQAGHDAAFLDFRTLPDGHWLREPIPAGFLPNEPRILDWTQLLDGVLYTDRQYGPKWMDHAGPIWQGQQSG